jgi:predicted CopG family antitoxin
MNTKSQISTTIRVHADTLEKLAKLGQAGQSYNEVLERILNEVKKQN